MPFNAQKFFVSMKSSLSGFPAVGSALVSTGRNLCQFAQRKGISLFASGNFMVLAFTTYLELVLVGL